MTKKKEHHITELYRLLSIIVIIITGITALTSFLVNRERTTEINDLKILAIIFAVVGSLFFVYLILIIMTLIMEYMVFSEKKEGIKEKEFLETIRNWTYNGFIFVVEVSILLIITLGLTFIVGIVVSSLIAVLILLLQIKIGYNSTVEKIKKRKWLILFLLAILVIMFFSLLVDITTKFDVITDKQFYTTKDEALVQIYPKGIVDPKIINVTYSNKRIPVEYVSNKDFSSPIYIKIPKGELVSEPYNSFIIIEYRHLNKLTRTNRKEFISVYPAE